MKKFTFPAIIIALIYFTGIITSCKETEDYDYFLVKVDSVLIPDAINANEPFEVKLSGIIGYNGCSSFERFITERQDSIILVEAWGKLRANSNICPDGVVGLNKEKLKYTIDDEGIYTLKVKQPDGTDLEWQIEAR